MAGGFRKSGWVLWPMVWCLGLALAGDVGASSCSMTKRGPTHLVVVDEAHLKGFHAEEEAELRRLGVIPKGIPFNGIIHLDDVPLDLRPASTDTVHPPVRCYVYNHIEGDTDSCGSTYERRCEWCDPEEALRLMACADAKEMPFALRLEYEHFDLLLDPKDAPRLRADPVAFFRRHGVLEPRPINGVVFLQLPGPESGPDDWRIMGFKHILFGKCASKYVKCEERKVRPPDFMPSFFGPRGQDR